jgi:hypothetical protein
MNGFFCTCLSKLLNVKAPLQGRAGLPVPVEMLAIAKSVKQEPRFAFSQFEDATQTEVSADNQGNAHLFFFDNHKSLV